MEKLEIARNRLPRYTGMPLEEFGDYILLTNFSDYLARFVERSGCSIRGEGNYMQAATNDDGLTMINFGIGTANAATIMDLLVAVQPKGVLLLGKCGGLKASTEIGHFVLPIAAIRGEGTSNDYFPPEVPALPSFKLHKFVSEKIVARALITGPGSYTPATGECGNTMRSSSNIFASSPRLPSIWRPPRSSWSAITTKSPGGPCCSFLTFRSRPKA